MIVENLSTITTDREQKYNCAILLAIYTNRDSLMAARVIPFSTTIVENLSTVPARPIASDIASYA
jgi:hypothetical protein